MKIFFLIILSLFIYSASAQNCDNWLKINNAFDAVTLGDLDINGTKMTIEASFNATGDITRTLVSKHIAPSDVNYHLLPDLAQITTTNGFFFVSAPCDFIKNKTYHVAMVYDGTTLTFYRNGYFMGSTPATGNLITNNWPTAIGENAYAAYTHSIANSHPLKGFINEVRIWNVARTQSEIRTYMNTSLPNPTLQTGLLAYYIFDNLLNKQGNSAFNGTLQGTASINATNTSCAFVADSCSTIPITQSVSSIINTYSPVIALNPCDNKITLEDASTFNIGDTVLIIQMKGAVIDSTNSSSFGNLLNYKNAGNYEFNYVKTKSGNVIELKDSLARQYDIPVGKVQLIRVPYYNSAQIISTLTCLPWDGNKGGVLVLNVADSIVLNADIDVSGKGFIGGKGVNTNTNTTNCGQTGYIYPVTSTLAALKGENIAIVQPDKASGRGAPSNGGGGGLDHNSGGGGGGNGGTGGFGGYQWESCGNAPFDNRGIGGRSLAYSNVANKIFMGGGGGAGHTNNPPAGGFNGDGANGGGIIIIKTKSLRSNGKFISANGASAISCIGNLSYCHEAGGGGGAAGTILIDTVTALDNINVKLNGGSGANMTGDYLVSRLGPGGGGAGGVLWVAANTLPVNLIASKNGGLNGVCTDINNDSWGATPGLAGINLFNLKIPVDIKPYKKNIDSLQIKYTNTCRNFIFFPSANTGINKIISWQWFFGDGDTFTINFGNGSIAHTYNSYGTFQVKLVVTDAGGCMDSVTITVSNNPILITKSNDTSICKNSSVQLFASGSSQNLQYSWSPATQLSNPNIANPVATPTSSITYYVTVSNASNCSTKDSIKIIVKNLLNITKSGDTSICKNTSVQLSASGGSQYSWSPASSLSNPNISNPIATPLSTTTYFITVADTNKCSSTDSIKITVNTPPVIKKSNDTSICKNTSVQLFANGGSQYVWSPSSSLNNPNIANPIATPFSTTTYFITVADTNKCIATDSVKVTVKSLATFTVSPDQSVCTNDSRQLFASGGNYYLWSPANSLTNPNISNPVATPLATTTYSVKIKDNICNDSTTLSTRIDVLPLPVIKATKANDVDCSNSSSQLHASGGNYYLWQPGIVLNDSTISSPIAKPITTTIFYVTGMDANGCKNLDTVTVNVSFGNINNFYVPNAFTPNNDGLNDCVGISYKGNVGDVDFSIYNRFGERVFHSTNVANCWDGRYKGIPQNIGIFVYIIKAKTSCGTIDKKGEIVLIR